MKRCFLTPLGQAVWNQANRSEQSFQLNNTKEHYE